MRFSARSLALVSAGALALVGLTAVPADAASLTGQAPVYNVASVTAGTGETISGTSVAASGAISVTITGGANVKTTAINNQWSVNFSAAQVNALSDGTVGAGIQETGSLACLLGCNASIYFTKDTVAPAAPTIAAIPGSGTNGVINASTSSIITASGSGEAGAKVTLTLGALSSSATVNGSGNWFTNFDASSLPDGTYTASARQTDVAGNVSPAGTMTVIKDTVGPRISTTSPVSGATVASPANVVFTYHDALAANSSIKVTSGSATIAGTSAASTGTLTWSPTAALTSGTYTAVASAYDAYGNVTTTTISFTVDATAPAITTLKSTGTSATVANSTLSGTLSEVATLTVTETDSAHATITKTYTNVAKGNFAYKYTENSFAAGTISVTIKAVDVYGNTSNYSISHTRTAPPVTTVALTVPTWSAVGWPLTITGAVHLAKPNSTYGSVTLVHRSLSGKYQYFTPAVSATGTFSYTYTPTTSGTYFAIYNGDNLNKVAQSEPVSSQVRYAISASTATGPATSNAIIGGAVHNPKPGAYVMVYAKNADGSWRQLGKAFIDSTYHYRLAVSLPKGKTAIRVTIPASNGYFSNSANVIATRS